MKIFYASSGNRTQGDCLEGKHVTTTPMVPNESYIDYNILDKYISVGDEKKGQTKLINDNREALAKLKKGFIHQNKLKKKHEGLVKMHQERIQDKKKQQMILHDLSSNPHEEDTKKELLKEYLILNNKISKYYISLTKEFNYIN